MPTPRLPGRPRGSSLLMVVIILGVLALLAAAALQIAEAQSVTVNKQISYERLLSCAEAAQKKLWAEYAQYGATLTNVFPTVVPGTNTLLQIGHYEANPGAAVSVVFDDKTFKPLDPNVASGGLREMDQTNTFRSGLLGQPYQVFAHCVDDRGRQYEVELLVRFGL